MPKLGGATAAGAIVTVVFVGAFLGIQYGIQQQRRKVHEQVCTLGGL